MFKQEEKYGQGHNGGGIGATGSDGCHFGKQEESKECKHEYLADYEEDKTYCITCGQIFSPSLLNDIETIEEIDLEITQNMWHGKTINKLIKNQRILIEVIKSLLEGKK